jgi:organic hydroperoxide reductase OsmC/OhrA
LKDLTIRLAHQPGALAAMGEALGRAGVSVEGGGGFVVDGQAVMHFLFENGARARAALAAADIEVLAERAVLLQRLDQQTPGQLGAIGRAMADAGVNIEVVYSDHQQQLVLVVDDMQAGQSVSEAWSARRGPDRKVREHHYGAELTWTGNRGTGTSGYRDYARDHRIAAPGKADIAGSSDPHFRGDAARWNPEELLVASLSACHQLWYLHLCADAGIVVTAYADAAEGVMHEEPGGHGHFARVVLRPQVTIASGDARQALALHARAQELCFIARSVNSPVETQARVRTETKASG